jgi:predicted nucleic acid-binding protein
LLQKPQNITFFACEFLKFEIFAHRERLMALTKRSHHELEEIQHLVTRHIQFISDELLDDDLLDQAEALLADIDPDDAPFLALAWQLRNV